MVVTLIIENLPVFLERGVVGNLIRPPPFRAAEKRQFLKSCHQF
jgi:hypothetical protein